MLVKNRELEAEIARYKEALAKMEKQWKAATEAVSESKLQKQIDDQTAELNAQNKQIIALKKEIQTLRLQAHMTEDESQLEPKGGVANLSETNNTKSAAMERIKELEKANKTMETELHEQQAQAKSKLAELDMSNKTVQKQLETANQRVKELTDENKQLRKMANADETQKLRADLKAALERIPVLESDLKKVTD